MGCCRMHSCGAHVARCTWSKPATRGWIEAHAAAGTAHTKQKSADAATW